MMNTIPKTVRFPKLLSLALCLCLLLVSTGCKNTDSVQGTNTADNPANKSTVLSDKSVMEIAKRAANQADKIWKVAPPRNRYAKRIKTLIGKRTGETGINFDCRAYLSNEINIFAMADGTIRINSGLMDLLDNDELLFIIGHEMGHIAEKHTSRIIRLAYTTRKARRNVSLADKSTENVSSRLDSFVQTIINSRFSPAEEQVADSYGLQYLRNKKANPNSAVSALKKLVALDKTNPFLLVHPEPAERAEILEVALGLKPADTNHHRFQLLYDLKEIISSYCMKPYEFGRKLRESL